ncbi:MAG: serine/threonine-protein kinase [Planctomycetaceae bacterium]
MPISREFELAVAYFEALDRGVCPDEFLREKLGVGIEAIADLVPELDKLAEELPRDEEVRELTPGTMVGRYEIVETLGRGATAVVYQARDTGNNVRFVTLKITQKRTNEPEVLNLLQHPRIPLLIESFETQNNEFATVTVYTPSQGCLEYLSGLNDQIQMRALLNITRELAATIQYIHSKGIVHCDVKPENILITFDGQPLLVDFGAATSPTSDSTFSCTTSFAPSSMTAAVLRNGVRELSTDFDFIGLARTFLFLSEYLFESLGSSGEGGSGQYLELLHVAKEIDIDDVIPSPHLTRFKGLLLSANGSEQSTASSDPKKIPATQRLWTVLLVILVASFSLAFAVNQIWPQTANSASPASSPALSKPGTLVAPETQVSTDTPDLTDESVAVPYIRSQIKEQRFLEAASAAEIAAGHLPDNVAVQILAAGLSLKQCELTGAAPNTVYFDRLLEMEAPMPPEILLDAAITYSITSNHAATESEQVMLVEKSNALLEASAEQLPVKRVQDRLALFREVLNAESDAYSRLSPLKADGDSP